MLSTSKISGREHPLSNPFRKVLLPMSCYARMWLWDIGNQNLVSKERLETRDVL